MGVQLGTLGGPGPFLVEQASPRGAVQTLVPPQAEHDYWINVDALLSRKRGLYLVAARLRLLLAFPSVQYFGEPVGERQVLATTTATFSARYRLTWNLVS